MGIGGYMYDFMRWRVNEESLLVWFSRDRLCLMGSLYSYSLGPDDHDDIFKSRNTMKEIKTS